MQVKAGRFEMMDKGLAGPCAAYCIYLSRMSTSQTSIGGRGACIPLVITEHSPTVLLYSTRESMHKGLCTSAHRVHTVHMWMPEYHCFKKVRHQEECVWGEGEGVRLQVDPENAEIDTVSFSAATPHLESLLTTTLLPQLRHLLRRLYI